MSSDWVNAIGTVLQALTAVLLGILAYRQRNVGCEQKELMAKQTEIMQMQSRLANEQTEIMAKQMAIMETQNGLALYERRFKIYESLMTLIGRGLCKGGLNNDDLIEFWLSSKEAGFLLDDELNSYIQEVQLRCNVFTSLSATEPKIAGDEMSQWVSKMDVTKKYLENAFDEVPKRFEKYLSFKENKTK